MNTIRVRKPKVQYSKYYDPVKRRKQYERNKTDELTKNKERNRARRDRLLQLLGGKCARCGFTDRRALQLDHKEGGGRHEMYRIFPDHNTMYIHYDKHPEEAIKVLQILCANCNWIKRDERGEAWAPAWVEERKDPSMTLDSFQAS